MCGEPQRPEIWRDDFPWDGEGFRLKNILIRRTVTHRALKGHSTVFNITFIISNFAHLHINQKILRKINPLFSFFSVYRILSN